MEAVLGAVSCRPFFLLFDLGSIYIFNYVESVVFENFSALQSIARRYTAYFGANPGPAVVVLDGARRTDAERAADGAASPGPDTGAAGTAIPAPGCIAERAPVLAGEPSVWK